jgi:RHS repeat-associated protein
MTYAKHAARRLAVTGAAFAVAASSALAQGTALQVVEYFHLDALGSIRAVSNASGQLVERHDYLPFGEECTTGNCAAPLRGSQPRQFTGKERDKETGLDYFGARYLASPTARFTTVDPVLATSAAIADPQRWNRYAYGRANPLRFHDPTGAILEITGDDREEAFKLIQDAVGPRGASLLYTREEDGRTFVEYNGREIDRLAASGHVGVLVANLIDSARITEFRVVNGDYLLQTRFQSVTIAAKGGAATIGAEESLNGNIQIFIGRASKDYMNQLSLSSYGRGMSADPARPLLFTFPLIAAHEIGHAEANLSGIPINSIVNDAMALHAENASRRPRGSRSQGAS